MCVKSRGNLWLGANLYANLRGILWLGVNLYANLRGILWLGVILCVKLHGNLWLGVNFFQAFWRSLTVLGRPGLLYGSCRLNLAEFGTVSSPGLVLSFF